jgi:hypothetical protein
MELCMIRFAKPRLWSPVGRMHSWMLLCLLIPLVWTPKSMAQYATPKSPEPTKASTAEPADVDTRLAAVSAALTETQKTLLQSMQRIEQLQNEVNSLRAEAALRKGTGAEPPVGPSSNATATESAASTSGDLTRMHEEQEAIQAEITQHEQIKVETASKYPVRVTGLLLFNAFSNAGLVDNIDLPSLAFAPTPGQSTGTVGASMRQTILGLEANGPRIAGAKTSGAVSVDFFGGLTYSPYTNPNGTVRLRRARIALDWTHTTLDGGIEEPLISPLSPSSYATVAQAALTWSGNLWTWAPQIRVEQRVPLPFGAVHLEAGVLDTPPTGKTTTQIGRIVSPGEMARQPAAEGRVSFHSSSGQHAFVLGLGAYTSQQSFTTYPSVHSWATTADWSVPLSRHFELTGEAYRGRALGGLGGSAYKNIITGIDPRTGLARTNGVDGAGGWSQIKWLVSRSAEANVSFGVDSVFASNFRRLQLYPTSTDFLQNYDRNSTILVNVILHPKTYLILSPEFRSIESSKFGDEGYRANVFTLSAGYSF